MLRRLGLIGTISSTAVADESGHVGLAVAEPPLQPGAPAEPREAVIAVVGPPLHLVLIQGLLLGFLCRLFVGLLTGR